MRKIVAALFLLLLLTGCSAAQYPDSEFLGRRSAEKWAARMSICQTFAQMSY